VYLCYVFFWENLVFSLFPDKATTGRLLPLHPPSRLTGRSCGFRIYLLCPCPCVAGEKQNHRERSRYDI